MKSCRCLAVLVLVGGLCASLLLGCQGQEVLADISVCTADIRQIGVPENAKVIGLGEASHGVHEYQQMKAEIFQILVENGCRTFVIEGDFGGSLKADAYIQGQEGSAEEAVGEIGFGIYQTHEMADLAEWMREYNLSVSEAEKLHFYGMDMQRYDNNKEYLFSVLDEADAELSKRYREAFAELTDEMRLNLEQSVLEQAKEDAQNLLWEMDDRETAIAAVSGQEAFDFARECANSIYECSELTASGTEYNTKRDAYMAEKVNWFVERSGGTPVFINGHNGHIGKVSASGYKCLGNILTEQYQDAYFTIGTDAAITRFHSQNDAGFSVMEVKNKNDLNAQAANFAAGFYYLEFSEAKTLSGWKEILKTPQTITTLNVGISSWQTLLKIFYTQTLTPADTYDAMIVFDEVTPTKLLSD